MLAANGGRPLVSATIDELGVGGEAGSWAALGFDVDGDELQLGTVLLRFDGGGGGIGSWTLRGITCDELDGLPTSASRAPERPPAAAHPNGAVAIDHLVAVTPDLDRTVAALRGAGLELRRIREEPTPAGAPRQAFFRLGEQVLEVVQEPPEVVERDGGVGRPARFWGLALVVEDIDASARAFSPHVGEVRAAVQPGRRIVTVRRSAGLPVPVALMSGQERA